MFKQTTKKKRRKKSTTYLDSFVIAIMFKKKNRTGLNIYMPNMNNEWICSHIRHSTMSETNIVKQDIKGPGNKNNVNQTTKKKEEKKNRQRI